MARRLGRIGLISLGFTAFGVGSVVLLSCLSRFLTPDAEAASPTSDVPSVQAAAGATPILVELFTSEGCSSCPSADVVATQIERTQPVAGAKVIVLAHHVDYWNQLGWPDPWSSNAASQRQRAYGKGTYTPQAIVDGNAEMVGSRGSAVESAIADAAKVLHSKIELDVTAIDKSTFDIGVRGAPATADVLVAVVQDRGRVAVPRGENAGKTLDHTSIVRSLTTASGAKTRVTVPALINAPGGSSFSVVGFAQDRSSRKILGSNAAKLTP